MLNFKDDNIEKTAKSLLGRTITHKYNGQKVSGYIVEVECYLGTVDQAAHSYMGKKTPSVRAMYKEGGHLYLYQMHGHTLLNIVCGLQDIPIAILIRAIEPLKGINVMKKNRKLHGYNLTNGPAKLCEALAIDMSHNKEKINERIFISEEKVKISQDILALPRIGVENKGKWSTKPLRFIVKGNPYVSDIKKSQIEKNWGWK